MMKKNILVVLLILMLLSTVSAQTQDEIKEKIMDFVGSNDAIIVLGTHSSSAERLLVMLTTDIYPGLKDMPIFEESEFDETIYSSQTIILIGGPSQNKISERVLKSNIDSKIEEFSGGRIVFIGRYMIYSDFAGFNNYPRTSQYKSPLSSVMPLAFVPVAATLISFSLLWLWNILRGIFESMYKGIIVNKIMKNVKKKDVRKEYSGFHFQGVRIKYREWIFIMFSAVIFAIAISYTYFTGIDAFIFIITSLFVNILIYTFQNFMRLFMDKHHQTHTEYHLWYFGVFLTLFSGWLGNTFGLAGYVSSEKGHEKLKSKIQYKTICFTFLFGILFLIINFMNPFELAQLIMISAISSSFMQMLPITPFSGKEIKEWNKKLWTLTFLPILACYIMVCLFF